MEVQTEKIIGICQKISKISIFILTFSVPIFFLPLTIDPFDFQKQFLFGILIFIALIFWLLKTFLSKKAEINFNFLNIPVLVFLLIYFLSTIFSSWRSSSFFGWPLNLSQGFLTLFYFSAFYFLVINILTKREEIFWLIFSFITSAFFVSIFAIFQIFGKVNFNPIGTLISLSVLFVNLLSLTILFSAFSKKFIRWILAVFSTFFLISLILINFPLAWLILIFESLILFIFVLLNLEKNGKFGLLFLSILILILPLLFLIFKISIPGIRTPFEAILNQKTETQILKNALQGFKNFLFGTGPATFIFNFSKFKPVEINQTIFWNIRLNIGASEILDKLITTGIFGILSLFFLFLAFFFREGKNLISLFKKNDWLFQLGLFSSFSGLVFSQFLVPENFSLLFFFWLILASLSALNSKIKTFSFQPLKLAISLTLIFFFAVSLSLTLIRNYLAEIKYFSGLKTWQKGELNQAINLLEGAINLNSLDSYQRDLSQIYLTKLNEGLRKDETFSKEEILRLIDKAVDHSKRASEISPQNVVNWSVRGFIYRNLVGMTEDLALDSYQKAIELEPKNPYLFNEIGLTYLAKADLLTRQGKEISETLVKAQENFQKAIELKPDYAPAHFQLAMVYQRQKKVKEAILKLEELKLIAASDSGLAFQLGFLYYNDNQLDLAKAEFERAVSLDENYSNARYFLGLVYDQQGEKAKAIEQFEKIEKLNPENLEVKKILENLKEGKSALEGMIPVQPPIEEKPPERLEK